MAFTFKAIATVTVGSGGAANIEFTSIPGTYTDLCVLASLRSANADPADDVFVSFNGSSANLSGCRLFAYNGSTVASDTSTNSVKTSADTATSNTFGNAMIYLPNYAGSTNKSISADSVSETNAANGQQALSALLWSQTSAITSIKINAVNGNLKQYSTATLYGIKNS